MRRLSVLLTILVLGTGLLYAHHGWTGYDTKLVQYTGVIKEAGYENPHAFIKMEVEKKTIWKVVLAPPARMESRGLTKDKLRIGATATIMGYPHKTTKGEIRAERITIDGKTTELR
jgi:hypothetical protein